MKPPMTTARSAHADQQQAFLPSARAAARHNPRRFASLTLAAAAMAVLLHGGVAQAAPTWSTTPTTGDWATGGNWAGGVAPVSGNAVDFNTSSTTLAEGGIGGWAIDGTAGQSVLNPNDEVQTVEVTLTGPPLAATKLFVRVKPVVPAQ
jgi:hypothetical protein